MKGRLDEKGVKEGKEGWKRRERRKERRGSQEGWKDERKEGLTDLGVRMFLIINGVLARLF
jgi:hypothetical protein